VARQFKRSRHGVTAHLEPEEVELLERLFADVARLLVGDEASAATPDWVAELGLGDLALHGVGSEHALELPQDPALARLLPDGRRDDPVGSAEFRRFTEHGLRDRKRTGLATAQQALASWAANPSSKQRLTLDQARAWTTALTDVRLVLAERLGIRTDEDVQALHEREDEADDLGPASWLASVYDFTTWVQESLTEVLLEDLPEHGDGRRIPPQV